MSRINIIELRLKVYLLQDVLIAESLQHIAKLIDSTLILAGMEEFHYSTETKMYSFSNLYPLGRNGKYIGGEIYTITIRTVHNGVYQALKKHLDKQYSQYFKALTLEDRTLEQKPIERIYTLNPVIIKFPHDKNTYWREKRKVEEFEKGLKINIIKKYNQINDIKVDEDFELFQSIQIDNESPMVIECKGVKLLGDKVTIHVASNQLAQDIAWLAAGVGLGEISSRGAGFCNFRYI